MVKMIALLLVASFISLAGCNMFQGLGKDIEQVGEKMQKKSQ